MSTHGRHRAERGFRFFFLLALTFSTAACAKTTQSEETAPLKMAAESGGTASAPPVLSSSTFSPGMFSVADVVEKVTSGVVNIHAEGNVERATGPSMDPLFNDPFFRHYFDFDLEQGRPRTERREALGSGVIVSADGLVVTNNHLVEKAEDIQVSLSDGRDVPAKVVGTDPKSDLAVLRLQGVENLTALKWGDSSRMRMGDLVLAIGNPYGVGQTVTMGIVSAVGRGNVGIVDYEDFIQTDAAINPGNSGGALVNMRGELIGINTAILSRSGGNQGVGFAIPADLAKPVIDSLIESGKYVRGWLGVTIQNLTAELAQGLGIEAKHGVLISDVMEDGPAKKAGLRRGDVVTKIAGRPVKTTAELRNFIAQAGPGTKVVLDIQREGATKTLEATLEELPADMSEDGPVASVGGALSGATFGDLSQDSRRRFAIPDSIEKGVVVTEVKPGSGAQRSGLRAGDVILELNRKPVKSASEFSSRYKKTKGALLLLVRRQSATIYIAIRN